MLTSLFAYAELRAREDGTWTISSDAFVIDADDDAVRAQFGDEAFRSRDAWVEAGRGAWQRERTSLIGRRPLARVAEAGFAVETDTELSFRATRGHEILDVATGPGGLRLRHELAGGRSRVGHTRDLGGVEDYLVLAAGGTPRTDLRGSDDWSTGVPPIGENESSAS